MTAHAVPPISPPPANIGAEQSLLGALLLSNAQAPAVAMVLEPSHFSEPLHKIIYEAISDAVSAGRPADLMTVGAALANLEMPEGSPTIAAYLARLATGAVTIRDAPQWALMVRDLAHRREIMARAQDMIRDASDAPITTTGAEILDGFNESVRHILETRATFNTEPTDAMAWRIVDEIERARVGEFKADAITTGFPRLDQSARYRPGDVVVTAGRPGQGKSVFAACSARRVAEAGFGVLEFPFEIGREQAVCRHLADLSYDPRAPICFSWLIDRDLRNPEYVDRIGGASRALNALPIEIDDAERLTVARIGARIQQAKANFAARGVRLAYVSLDHLDFIQASDRYAGNRTQEIGEIMIGLKAIARREKIVLHLFSQLSRAVESRDDKRPTLSDLRNSGDIEQVADIVQFLYRPAYYLEAQAQTSVEKATELEAVANDLEIIRGKVRSGITGTTRLFVDVGASHVEGFAQ